MHAVIALAESHLQVVVATAHHNGYLATRVDLLDELPDAVDSQVSVWRERWRLGCEGGIGRTGTAASRNRWTVNSSAGFRCPSK
jgi:hypothetical protein